MTTRKYEASGVQAEFEPGSRNRVLRNLIGIVRVRGRPLRFRSLDMRGKQPYLAAIHAAMSRNYLPWAALFRRVIDETVASNRR